MKIIRLVIAILSLLATPPLIAFGFANPMIKDYGVFTAISFIVVVVVCWFVTDTLTELRNS